MNMIAPPAGRLQDSGQLRRLDATALTPVAPAEPSIMQVADAEKYADFRTEVRPFSSHSPAFFAATDEDGMVLRFGTTLFVEPLAERFRIAWWPGATDFDLAFAETIISDVKAGHFADYPWRTLTSKRTGVEYFGASIGAYGPENDLRYQRGFLVECTEPGCSEYKNGYHLSADRDEPWVMHVATENFDCESYEIQLTKPSDGAEWGVTVHVDRFEPLNHVEIASMVSDLQWVNTELKKLNEGMVG